MATRGSTPALTATISLAPLDGNGSVVVPPDAQDALLEIGCSDRSTLDEDMLDARPHSFLLSFEPQLDKYAVLLARGTKRAHGRVRDRSVQLGHHHKRGIVLPLAVSPTGGPVQLSVQHVAGCSSLVALNRRAAWAPWCSTHLETRTVPSVTLTQALAFIPSRLPIALLKVDAQGVDFALIASTDARLLRRRGVPPPLAASMISSCLDAAA